MGFRVAFCNRVYPHPDPDPFMGRNRFVVFCCVCCWVCVDDREDRFLREQNMVEVDMKMFHFMGTSLPPRAMKQWVEDTKCSFLSPAEKVLAKELPPRYFW